MTADRPAPPVEPAPTVIAHEKCGFLHGPGFVTDCLSPTAEEIAACTAPLTAGEIAAREALSVEPSTAADGCSVRRVALLNPDDHHDCDDVHRYYTDGFLTAVAECEARSAARDADLAERDVLDAARQEAHAEVSTRLHGALQMLAKLREHSDRICNWFWHNDPAALKDDGVTDAVLKKLDAQAAELTTLREELAQANATLTELASESWTEYGVRWLREKPTPDSSDVDVRGDSRENYTVNLGGRGPRLIEAGKGAAEGAAYDYGRDGYECRVEFRTVTAGPWQHAGDDS